MITEIRNESRDERLKEQAQLTRKIAFFVRSYRIRFGQEIADTAKRTLTEAVYFYYANKEIYAPLGAMFMVIVAKRMLNYKLAADGKCVVFDDDETEFDMINRIVTSPIELSDFPEIDLDSSRIAEIHENGSEVIQEILKYKPRHEFSA